LNYFAWLLIALITAGQPASPRAPDGTAPVQIPSPDETLRGKTYVALGDSLAVGAHAATMSLAFPSRVAEQLGMNLVVVGRSGARAAWAAPHLPEVWAAQPAMVTVELGTNDVGFATPLEDFAQQYDSIIAGVSAPGTRVLCVGSWLPGPDLDALIRRACERHGGTFVTLEGFYETAAFHAVDGAPTFRGPADWFHPGDVGHAAIAAAILTALRGGSAGDPASPPPLPPAPASMTAKAS